MVRKCDAAVAVPPAVYKVAVKPELRVRSPAPLVALPKQRLPLVEKRDLEKGRVAKKYVGYQAYRHVPLKATLVANKQLKAKVAGEARLWF